MWPYSRAIALHDTTWRGSTHSLHRAESTGGMYDQAAYGAHSSATRANSRRSDAKRRPAGTQAPTHTKPACFCGCTPSTSRRSHTSSYCAHSRAQSSSCHRWGSAARQAAKQAAPMPLPNIAVVCRYVGEEELNIADLTGLDTPVRASKAHGSAKHCNCFGQQLHLFVHALRLFISECACPLACQMVIR